MPENCKSGKSLEALREVLRLFKCRVLSSWSCFLIERKRSLKEFRGEFRLFGAGRSDASNALKFKPQPSAHTNHWILYSFVRKQCITCPNRLPGLTVLKACTQLSKLKSALNIGKSFDYKPRPDYS